MSIGISKSEQLINNKVKKPRQKKCKHCKEWFTPQRPLQMVCGDNIECAIEYSKVAVKKQREQTKRAFRNNDKSLLKEKVQKLANRYGRLRDEFNRGYGCCTCDKKDGKMDGGHFLPTSSYRPIRYNVNQIHQQCIRCNQYNNGMSKEYRVFMISKYNLEYVEELESNKQGDRKYTVDYFQKYLRIIGKRLKKMQKST